jgi:hypothetical protein
MFEAKLVNRVSVEEEPSSYRVGPQFGLDRFRKKSDKPYSGAQVYRLREVSRKYAKV